MLSKFSDVTKNDENSKQIIVKLANKEFIPNRSIYEIKKKQLILIQIFVRLHLDFHFIAEKKL